MASTQRINHKSDIVSEIENSIKNSETMILFTYHGLTVKEVTELRKKLKEADSNMKIYKNTFIRRALKNLDYDLETSTKGPNAVIFGKDLLSAVKIIDEFAKKHKVVDIKTGIINGNVVNTDTIKEYASIPSYEGLLTMLAGGMMQSVKNLAISLDLYSKQLEEN